MKNKRKLRKVAGGAINIAGDFSASGNVRAVDNSTKNSVKNMTEDHSTSLTNAYGSLDITLY